MNAENIRIVICANDEMLRGKFSHVDQDDRQDCADEWFQVALATAEKCAPEGVVVVACSNFQEWNGGKHYTEGWIHADYYENEPIDPAVTECIDRAESAADGAVEQMLAAFAASRAEDQD
jgi:hypothetical protein